MYNKTGIIFGTYDLLHPGHLFSFKFARKYCDNLIVGLHSDPSVERSDKNKPVQSLFERYYQLLSCKNVNEVIPYDTESDLLNIMKLYEIDCRFIGMDYVDKDFTDRKYCEDNYIYIHYIPRDHNFSSSNMRKRVKEKK